MDKKSTILVIDDEPALRLGLAAIIKRQGYEVCTAVDGIDGMQKARDVLPDLILSDVMMPPPNGFEMRKMMRHDPQLSGIPFIFLTARTGVEDRISGIRDGADDYVTKPYVPAELLVRIEAVLRRVHTEQERGREQMKEIAERNMERLKQEILQNFHHELRTPLTNIIMPLELVLANKFSTPEEQIRFIRMALANVDRLDSLIADFIVLSNIDHGDLNRIRQNIDVANHILIPINKKLERYKSNELKFVHNISQQYQITAPRREFSLAILHLVENAFKFSPQNGKVELIVQPGVEGGATITVQDDGQGIPNALREKVFERFYQGSQGDSRSFEGLGVGLTIARAVFENMGGSVSIMDSAQGCRVQAILPGLRPEDISYG